MSSNDLVSQTRSSVESSIIIPQKVRCDFSPKKNPFGPQPTDLNDEVLDHHIEQAIRRDYRQSIDI